VTTREDTRFALLCDADGCLFPSEEPAYAASAQVTALFLADHGIRQTFSADELRLEFTGMNFRSTAAELCRRHRLELPPDVLEQWVQVEKDVVTHHLEAVLRPDETVLRPLAELAPSVQLAVVSSSAAGRVEACLAATGLDVLFAPERRFSAEDLRPPASKPDPAVYLRARHVLHAQAPHCLAVEDSAVGVRAAAAAGVPVVGLVQFVPGPERAERREALLAAGACAVVETWDDVAAIVVHRRVAAGRADEVDPVGSPRVAPPRASSCTVSPWITGAAESRQSLRGPVGSDHPREPVSGS
jgi:HAD superfamily hydrolase (TIGR01509 family)